MPSGFTTRTKGRASFGAVYPLQEILSQKLQAGVTGQSTTIDPAGLTIVTSTAGSAVLTLGPPETGTYKTIVITTQSSGSAIIKTNSTGVTFFDGTNSYWNKGSTATAVVAGAASVLHIVGISTSQWAVLSAFPYESTVSTPFATSS